MKVCEILDPGMLCTIQDLGRKGPTRTCGMSVAGIAGGPFWASC